MALSDGKLPCTNISWTKMLVLIVVTVMAMAAMFTESFFLVRVIGLLEVVVDAKPEQRGSANQEGHILEWLDDIDSGLTSLESKANTKLRTDVEHFEDSVQDEIQVESP